MTDHLNARSSAASTLRLTAAQAVVRYIGAQFIEQDGAEVPLFGGVWAIFGHGNVAGLGEALHAARDVLPTYRAHNEQAMAHAAIAYAKAHARRRMMVCTSSIGPGALNMVTAAALAHVNRLPVLFLPGDVFASRRPDPVLQQVEDFADATVTANDCFRPVSRYFDRITRPEQLLAALPRALEVLTDPVLCGPVTLAMAQDVQAEAADFPAAFFARRVHYIRRPGADETELARAVEALRGARNPFIIAGGGVRYAGAEDALAAFAARHGVPVGETQAGKGSLNWAHPQNMGALGVTGTSAANALAAQADVILAVGTRLQDFTTGSRALFANPDLRIVHLNVAAFDAAKHGGMPLVADAARGLAGLTAALTGWRADAAWTARAATLIADWRAQENAVTAASAAALPSDAQVVGAVNRQAGADATVVCAAGGLPGELHKLWRAENSRSYHLEYGFSCMGYEIAGGLGVKLAHPERDVYVMVGDGSYLMLNSEIAVSVMLGLKLTILVLDNRGYGCINRLQMGTGGAPFNNLLADSRHEAQVPVDFAAHAASLGALSCKVSGIAGLEAALAAAKTAPRTSVIVIDTDPYITSGGGAWWDVAVPEVSLRGEVNEARATYEQARAHQRLV
ncbi:3D-(3,5/4)-trihydroxycyclohexane-1,2-dione acylhydrolase (decyclizing) [Acidocella aquatica]|uniref:3D-(3,5/4)-trihydroxycyclohexane-1,2-dione acylhydrolase (Decyclizing) n=1 Tax=Acidocella aquatica TaxID=1922313 RepID=A0ABQ6A4N4_9PROT|nr:3D-(3,5/4)-trihydroxycyclohexane-1,2-dione acylhydrolase (decyclizing) [Acidocella aquatica]GLR67129.1 3D-(3,5/4)-trihydroxycyclohexane-1,2-dione acylhydrolase (decyclizing) [Acidocella aquatica]